MYNWFTNNRWKDLFKWLSCHNYLRKWYTGQHLHLVMQRPLQKIQQGVHMAAQFHLKRCNMVFSYSNFTYICHDFALLPQIPLSCILSCVCRNAVNETSCRWREAMDLWFRLDSHCFIVLVSLHCSLIGNPTTEVKYLGTLIRNYFEIHPKCIVPWNVSWAQCEYRKKWAKPKLLPLFAFWTQV